MEPVYAKIVGHISDVHRAKGLPNTLIVGVAGVPGAGKSTVAHEICRRLNSLHDPDFTALCVPMDGFHLYRSELDAMRDAQRAHDRRGSPFTFDSKRFGDLLNRIRNRDSPDEVIIRAPSFDHKVADPVADEIVIEPRKNRHRIIVVEGNYLYLRSDEDQLHDPEHVWYWHEVDLDVFDVRAFIDISIEDAMERVRLRHMTTGLSDEQARKRINQNDQPNAEKIQETKTFASIVLQSTHDV